MINVQLEIGPGLNLEDIPQLQSKYGKNEFNAESKNRFAILLWGILKEPMFLLLVGACVLYFILGEPREGSMMIVAICIVVTISIYQEFRSSNALHALRQLTDPTVVVIRGNKTFSVPVEELVPGDLMFLTEGEKIPADAIIIQSNDFSVNEAVITGESFPVTKNKEEVVLQGTLVNSGKCYARVNTTGTNTQLGKLGTSIINFPEIRTALQQQIGRSVKKLAFFGIAAFFVIFIFNYSNTGDIISSILFGLTLAMAAIPEEIPVAFSSFMALGAYHMSRKGIISRQPQVIENLGAVTTICLDKTGTITENKMEVKFVYDFGQDILIDTADNKSLCPDALYYGILASETEPFDEMERAIWKCYQDLCGKATPLSMIHEYPLEGQPPMMTHVYMINNIITVAAKGAAERIVDVCKLIDSDRDKIFAEVRKLSSQGFRVIGVANAIHTQKEYPASQDDFNWVFKGLLALYDPPRKDVGDIFSQLNKAGIRIKLLTGDYLETATNIAGRVGMIERGRSYTGEEVMKMQSEELMRVVNDSDVFARMFPDAKLKVINALIANHEIVAMTGDGVNDGPAIKAAHIGIAMGKKGTEIARQAADLIITDDDLGKIVLAIAQGRKIYNNLKKAIRYIISIHIPIILTAALPIILGWKFPNIFTPIHVIFLELIMGPTCSIFFEKEPAEENAMQSPPRNKTLELFTNREVVISCIQGLVIAGGILGLYFYYMQSASLEQTRSIVFITLICCNTFLTFVNRSLIENIFKTIRYKNNLAVPVLIISIAFLLAIMMIPSVQSLFGLVPVSMSDFFVCLVTAFISVFWYEVYKTLIRKK